MENGVVMLSLPPHCSHRLQPLDHSVYGPLKKLVYSACDSWILSHPGNSMSIYDIPAIVASSGPAEPGGGGGGGGSVFGR